MTKDNVILFPRIPSVTRPKLPANISAREFDSLSSGAPYIEDMSSHGVIQSEFADIMLKNQEQKERLRLERLKANAAVLKSYQIKPKQTPS